MREYWEQMSNWAKAQLIAYNQIREYEDSEERADHTKQICKSMGAKVSS